MKTNRRNFLGNMFGAAAYGIIKPLDLLAIQDPLVIPADLLADELGDNDGETTTEERERLESFISNPDNSTFFILYSVDKDTKRPGSMRITDLINMMKERSPRDKRFFNSEDLDRVYGRTLNIKPRDPLSTLPVLRLKIEYTEENFVPRELYWVGLAENISKEGRRIRIEEG